MICCWLNIFTEEKEKEEKKKEEDNHLLLTISFGIWSRDMFKTKKQGKKEVGEAEGVSRQGQSGLIISG